MRKPQPHLAKQQCSQPGIREKLSNRKVQEEDVCHAMEGSGYRIGTRKRGDRRHNWKRDRYTWARATRQQDRGRTWTEGSMLLCQVRPQQAPPPLTHLKAASTHNVQGEPSGANSAEKNHTCCLRSSAFVWNMADKHPFKPGWRKG